MPSLLSTPGRGKALAIGWTAVVVLGLGVCIRASRLANDTGAASGYVSVRSVLVRRLSVPAASIRPGMPLDEEFGGVRIDRTELLHALEEELTVTLPEESALQWHTVADVVKSIRDSR